MKFEVKVELINGKTSSFITKEYDSYSPVKKTVGGFDQIGFIKDGATRFTWIPFRGVKYQHNVKTITVCDAGTGRRMETITTDNN